MYYQIPFVRCAELDVLFGTVIAFCIYIVLKPLISSKTVHSVPPQEEKKESEEKEHTNESDRHVYSVEFIRQCNTGKVERNYSIITKAPENVGRYSPTPGRYIGKNSDSRMFFRNHTPEPIEFVTRSPRSRLSEEEERQFNQSMREMTPDYCPLAAADLPKDIQMGRVHWKKNNNGRIHVLQPINGIKDIFFHIHDCELEPGDEINLGDSVMFELSLFEGRLCAVHVKKMATKAIPSPDFSRRVMKHSQEESLKVDNLVL